MVLYLSLVSVVWGGHWDLGAGWYVYRGWDTYLLFGGTPSKTRDSGAPAGAYVESRWDIYLTFGGTLTMVLYPSIVPVVMDLREEGKEQISCSILTAPH